MARGQLADAHAFSLGDVAGVRKDLWAHEGIIAHPDARGIPTVIAASGAAGCVVHQSWEDFSLGQRVRRLGYFGRLPPELVVERAARELGRAYAPITFNCQHLTRHAHGIEPFSWQVRAYSLGGAALLWWFLR